MEAWVGPGCSRCFGWKCGVYVAVFSHLKFIWHVWWHHTNNMETSFVCFFFLPSDIRLYPEMNGSRRPLTDENLSGHKARQYHWCCMFLCGYILECFHLCVLKETLCSRDSLFHALVPSGTFNIHLFYHVHEDWGPKVQQSIHVQPAGPLNSAWNYSLSPLYFSRVTECFVISPVDHPQLKCLIIKCFVDFFLFYTASDRQTKWSELLWACSPIYNPSVPASCCFQSAVLPKVVYQEMFIVIKNVTRHSSSSSFSNYIFFPSFKKTSR